jgi:predicted DNA-binding protein with PD1-like motif
VIASTSPQTTSVDSTYFDLGSGNRVVVLWAEANTIKYRATTSAAPAYSFDTEATLIGSLTDTDPCPQWIQNSDAIGALYMDAGSVKVEWLIAPASGTPKSAPDSQGIISSEGSSLVAAIPRADSQAFGSAEVSRIAFATTDSQAFGSAEVARIAVTKTDSQSIGSVESASMSAIIPKADSQAIGSLESPTLVVDLDTVADSQAIGSLEDPDVSFGNTPKSAPDSQAFGSTETSRIGVPKTDSQSIISAEVSSLVALLSRADSQAIGSSETARPGPRYVDSRAIGSAETFRVGLAMNDSQAFGSAEGLALDVSVTVADSQAIGSVESPSLNLIQKSANDSQAIGSSETRQLVITKGDTQAIGSSESPSVAVHVSVADTITFTSSEFAYEGELDILMGDAPYWKYLIP